jgi:hypothetical protein
VSAGIRLRTTLATTTSLSLNPKTLPKLAHRLSLHVRQGVGVDVERGVDAGVPEDLLQDLRVFAGLKLERGEGVA